MSKYELEETGFWYQGRFFRGLIMDNVATGYFKNCSPANSDFRKYLDELMESIQSMPLEQAVEHGGFVKTITVSTTTT